MTKIDVLVINRNFNTFIPGLLDTLLAQTLPQADFTVNVLDYGSDKRPDDIIAKYPQLEIKYYKRNCHMQAARNFLAENTTSKYLIYLDADLLLKPEFLEEHLKAIEEDKEEKYAYVYSDFEYKRESGWVRQKTQDYIDRLGDRVFPTYIPIPCWSLIRRKYFTRWDEEFAKLQDWCLWCDIWVKHKKTGRLIPKVLTRHIQDPNYSIGWKLRNEHQYWKRKLVAKYPELFKNEK